jgi:hypothetical protein
VRPAPERKASSGQGKAPRDRFNVSERGDMIGMRIAAPAGDEQIGQEPRHRRWSARLPSGAAANTARSPLIRQDVDRGRGLGHPATRETLQAMSTRGVKAPPSVRKISPSRRRQTQPRRQSARHSPAFRRRVRDDDRLSISPVIGGMSIDVDADRRA